MFRSKIEIASHGINVRCYDYANMKKSKHRKAYNGMTESDIERSDVDEMNGRPYANANANTDVSNVTMTASCASTTATSTDDDTDKSDYSSVGRSSMMMTALVLVSRITGFIRTWAMGFAFGVSMISTSYNVANNLPNMLYELVMGGMLVTAFLPVYMEVRQKRGNEAANDYVGNLLGILLLLLGGLSVLATVFAPALIWTQSFMSGSNAASTDLATWFFRFFAVQVLLYGLGSVFSGVLNAHRDYFWSNFAPVLNNVVTIASFTAFVPLSSVNETLALVVVAAGTTLGVFVQMACQIPALKRHGVRPRLHIDWHDHTLRQTVSLGLPTLIATACTFVTSSVQTAAALAIEPETGVSISSYARLWYTLPYALLAVPLTTALYTELSRDVVAGNTASVRDGISRGISQLMFYLLPFMMYLVVFSVPLNMIYASGRFDMEGVRAVADYLCYLAVALPLYGVCMLMQKACSALRDMKPYMLGMLAGAAAQIAVCLVCGVQLGCGLRMVALSTAAFYVLADVVAVLWCRRRLGGLHGRSIVKGTALGCALGLLGAVVGCVVMCLLQTFVVPLTVVVDGVEVARSTLMTFGYVAVAGVASLVATFGTAVVLRLPEVEMISGLVRRFKR